MSRTKVLWGREPTLQAIRNGRKRVEMRVGIFAVCNQAISCCSMSAIPTASALFASLHRMKPCWLGKILGTLAPRLPAEEILPTLRTLYPPTKDALGVDALEIEPVDTSTNQPETEHPI
nr:hypothetical protein [Ardenticatena sp.]